VRAEASESDASVNGDLSDVSLAGLGQQNYRTGETSDSNGNNPQGI
jgi:hypothetical protein